MTAKRLDNLLNADAPGGLEKIIQTAQKMDSLAAVLRAALSPAEADSVVAANVRNDGHLVVVCRSSAWAARLRFHDASLLDSARAAGFEVDKLKVMVSQG